MDDTRKYDIALTLIPGIGPVLAKGLIAYLGSSEAIFKEKRHRLLKVPGIGEKGASAIASMDIAPLMERVEQELGFMETNSITPLFYNEQAYPSRLKRCDDAPLVLYKKGNMDLNVPRLLAVIGTRSCTDYGRQVCEDVIEGLQGLGVGIVSGLAYGIDIVAHRASLKNKLPTAGVLAHGLHTVYPSMHRSVAKNMQEAGALISEFISGTQADKENFPRRNRIVAGMTDATLVIETGVRGGSMITVAMANSYNRDVFAVPGRVGQPQSAGCNRLIMDNRAALVESASDVARMMGWDQEDKARPRQERLFPEVSIEEQQLLDALVKSSPLEVDVLCRLCNFPVAKTSTLLLNLEFAGLVRSLPGKRYELS